MIRIAIIEDDDDMMRIVSKCVKESSMGVADLDICCLTNAEDFLDKAKQEEFDILFSDIELPGMNGIELGKNGQREISRTVLSIFDIPFRIRRRKLYN